MEGKLFLSQEFSLAVNNYLATKSQKLSASLSFSVIVVRTLVQIYGELDVINPYMTKNEKDLGGFDQNLKKYGLPDDKLEDFKRNFSLYLKSMKEVIKPNLAFIELEKRLIDMFFYKMKAMELGEEEVLLFKSYLCLSENLELKDYTSLYMTDVTLLDHYFMSKYYQTKHEYELIPVKNSSLYLEAYTILGYDQEQLAYLTKEEEEELNQQVIKFFHLPNKKEIDETFLVKAIQYYKKYGNRLTTGNGYVDIILLMSVISTVAFILLLISVKLF